MSTTASANERGPSTLARSVAHKLSPTIKALVSFSRHKPLGAAGAFIIVCLGLIAIFAPLIAPFDPSEPHIPLINSGPSKELALGGDQLGRDILSRLFYGARISLMVGVASVGIGITVGSLLGVISAHFGGLFDLLMQRIVDGFIAFPAVILGLTIMAVLGSSVTNITIAIIFVLAPGSVRAVRSQALAIKETDYVLAARAIGCGHSRIIIRYLIPNCLAVIMIIATITLGFAIILESSFSFLGVGVPPDVPTWGGMLADATESDIKNAPWLYIFPGIAIALAVFAVNLLGDAMRDVLDPRLRGS